MPALRGSWAACTEGLAHPHTGAVRPIVFDHALAEGRDDVVLVHLNHRLVQMALRLLRAEIWSPGGAGKLARVTARLVPDLAFANPVVLAHARLLLVGGDNTRLHEELIIAGGVLEAGRFTRMTLEQLEHARAVAEDSRARRPAPAPIQAQLARLWPEHGPALDRALEIRMRERTGTLQRLLADRAAKEVRDITLVLTELRTSIERELKQASRPVQTSYLSQPELEQFHRNMSSLEARVRVIPDEIRKETEAIRARFADPQPRLFPVAVTYLVPNRLARG
jgi:hypothetical protein